MKLKIAFSNFLLILILLSFSDCNNKSPSENPKKGIVGNWESANKSLIVEFKSDQELRAQKKKGSFFIESISDIIFIDDAYIDWISSEKKETWSVPSGTHTIKATCNFYEDYEASHSFNAGEITIITLEITGKYKS